MRHDYHIHVIKLDDRIKYRCAHPIFGYTLEDNLELPRESPEDAVDRVMQVTKDNSFIGYIKCETIDEESVFIPMSDDEVKATLLSGLDEIKDQQMRGLYFDLDDFVDVVERFPELSWLTPYFMPHECKALYDIADFVKRGEREEDYELLGQLYTCRRSMERLDEFVDGELSFSKYGYNSPATRENTEKIITRLSTGLHYVKNVESGLRISGIIERD
ncbi:hypothetical protein GOV11_01430 [Candidatus Woesearchaeota archaeon]|nr:hypothetical protein [Candidatus Woesearchaeota archaeon]